LRSFHIHFSLFVYASTASACVRLIKQCGKERGVNVDFIDNLKIFASRAVKLKDQIQTEEATKTALIMPFFQQVLGYDVFNPDEFVPEFTADVGIKKGEKVDYAIMINGQPIILIEAKFRGEALEKHDSQLFRYFATTSSLFAILTNGIVYRFYADLDKKNTMDLEPFLEIDLLNLRENLVPELKKFCKSAFNAEEISSAASALKYSSRIKAYLSEQLREPNDEFVRFFMVSAYNGMKTQAVIEKFRPIVKKTLNEYITELMNDRITDALKGKEESPMASSEPVPMSSEPEKNKIETTQNEIEAYYIIKTLLSDTTEVSRICYKDNINYFSVLLDGKPSRWICRLILDKAKQYMIVPDDSKRDKRFDIDSIADIYKYKNELTESLKRCLQM
jgi:hypothetical protein